LASSLHSAGRSETKDQPGKEHVAVLSHALWDSQFGGDRNVVGRTIMLDGAPHTVIGVLPAGGAFDRAFAQIWRPLVFEPQNMTRNFHWFGAYGKLKRGVTLKQATAQMDTIGARIAHDYPDSNKGWGVSVEAFADTVVGNQLRQSLYVLLSAVGMVLLIGCANLANLTLARGTAREREVAIRASVGAGRWRLVCYGREMLFMVIERFKGRDARPIYRRLLDPGDKCRRAWNTLTAGSNRISTVASS